MKNFFLAKILRWIGSKFDGWKTRIGGCGAFLMGLLYGLPLLFPYLTEQGLPEGNIERASAAFTAAFTVWGLGGKGDKIKKQLEGVRRIAVKR
jgi:hypothetical protein